MSSWPSKSKVVDFPNQWNLSTCEYQSILTDRYLLALPMIGRGTLRIATVNRAGFSDCQLASEPYQIKDCRSLCGICFTVTFTLFCHIIWLEALCDNPTFLIPSPDPIQVFGSVTMESQCFLCLKHVESQLEF